MRITIEEMCKEGQTVSVDDGKSVFDATWMDAFGVFIRALRGMGYQIHFDDDEAVGVLEQMNREASPYGYD